MSKTDGAREGRRNEMKTQFSDERENRAKLISLLDLRSAAWHDAARQSVLFGHARRKYAHLHALDRTIEKLKTAIARAEAQRV